jgi:TatD DNase family protein
LHKVLTDTHCHLYSEVFDGDRAEAMAKAVEAGVGRMLLPNVDGESWEKLPDLMAGDSPDLRLYPMLGIHPCSVDETWPQLWDRMKAALGKQGPELSDNFAWVPGNTVGGLDYVGIGEIGIDLYWRQDNLALQQEAFLAQVLHAIHLDLPVCIHSRESLQLILDSTKDLLFRGVYHCYGGSLEQALTITERGQYMGIGGTVTFKSNQALRDVLKIIGPQRVVMETDAPYLAPVPYRGKRNEPFMIAEVAQCLGEIWGMSAEEAGERCSRNAAELWRIPV